MKKFVALFMAVIMAFSLIACGSKTESGSSTSDAVELTFWVHQEDAWNVSYQKIVDDFHALHPNITINLESYPYEEFESKVQTSLISKSGGADIYELWGGWGVDFAPTGALAAMPDDMANEIYEDAYPCTYGALQYDGKLYGMPMEFNIEAGGMLVNNNILNENNFKVATTWDELIEQAAAVTQFNGDICTQKGFDPIDLDCLTYLFTSMILSQGGQYLNEDGTFNFTSPEAVKAFKELVDLNGKTTDILGFTGGDGLLSNVQQLYTGTTLYVPRGPWSVSDGLVTFGLTLDKDFSYAPLPWYGDKVAFAAESGWALGVNGSSENQEAAWEFINYFFSEDVLLSHNLACGQIPAKRSVAQSDKFLSAVPYVKHLVDILDNAQFIGFFNTDTFKATVCGVYTDYCTTDKYSSVEAALADLEVKLANNL